MRKTSELIEKNGELKRANREENSVQIRLLDFILKSRVPISNLLKELNQMYEITVDKAELSQTIDDLPFSLMEILSASDILAWILEIPKKIHKKNRKAIKKL